MPDGDTLPSDELHAVAARLADAARDAILPWFRRSDLAADNKDAAAFDPVTEADRAAERVMRDILAGARPDDGIIGEEYGTKAGTSGLTWVLDPVDGTRGFISGTPTWGVLIALCDETGPRLGVIDQPYIRERFTGGLGRADVAGPSGTAPLRSRPDSTLAGATLFTTFPEIGTPDDRAAFERVSSVARLTRYGTDCYGYALVAVGQVDLVIEAGLHPYDVCAPIAVVEAAGGIVTDWEGNPVHGGGRVLAAANPRIHAEAMARLAG